MLMYEELSHKVLAACIEVHRELGPGLLESAYEECLCRELSLRSIAFRRQCPLPVSYKGVRLDCGYTIDIVIDDKLLIEIKSVDEIHPRGPTANVFTAKWSACRFADQFQCDRAEGRRDTASALKEYILLHLSSPCSSVSPW